MTTNKALITFAPITAAWDRVFVRTLPDAAQVLPKYVRRMGKSGTMIEFELKDFIAEQPYLLKRARYFPDPLVNHELVEVLHIRGGSAL